MSVIHIQHSIEGVIKYLSEHPDECRYTDSAATAVVEEGLRCRAEGPNGRMLMSDMPTAIGGGGSAPSPRWLSRPPPSHSDAPGHSTRPAPMGGTLTTLKINLD